MSTLSASFADLGLRPELVERLRHADLTVPTPIQTRAIPVLIAGRDVIAQAQTGTGKTLAFLLPILERVDVGNPAVQALILTPTRELAIQITAEAGKFAPVTGANVLATYGGQDVESQIKRLHGATQIVATPGRLLDHLRRGTVSLDQVATFVLDEADQMLHIGFLPEVEQVMEQLPADRSMLLFSATMPKDIRTLARRFMRTPAEIRIASPQVTVSEVRQVAVEVTDRGRQAALRQKLDEFRPRRAVIFCRTKIRADKLLEALTGHGYSAGVLHGNLSQRGREEVMQAFREGQVRLLVATDVAARGIDVEGVTHVFNYDIPHDAESYIHRIGRTGRAGQAGVAVTFVSPKDRATLQQIEKGIKTTLEREQARPAPHPVPVAAPKPRRILAGRRSVTGR